MGVQVSLLQFFNRPWQEVPTIWIDTETTGLRPGIDRAVQVGLARFESGLCVGSITAYVDPDIRISEEAFAIHGISNAMVDGEPSIEALFERKDVKELLRDAQPAAYNGPFDREFVPRFLDEWMWPWIDCLSVVRAVDPFVKGKGRHKLDVSCKRHGIEIAKAHDAGCDATAAGDLFYKVAPQLYTHQGRGRDITGSLALHGPFTLGELLHKQRLVEADGWFDFNKWLSRQPPKAQAE